MAKSIMFVGTSSSAGKSIFVTAMCRILSDKNYKVAPFKSQNMALNSYIDDENLEYGRAQAVQAFASRIKPNANMNPILLKPTSDRRSQVILLGKKDETYAAKEYYQVKSKYLPYIKKAYETLSNQNDVIVLEGAGSPAEINLLDGDFVNMGMSEIADAPVILVADIERGGVFASIYGTIMLTPEKWRKNYKGIIINKFRGDNSILESGIRQIEDMLGIPVISIMPYIDVDIEEEDSLNLRESNKIFQDNKINISILKLKNLANFTEFAPLSIIEDVNINYIDVEDEIDDETDLLIIPPSKNIYEDLQSIKNPDKFKNFKGNIIAVGNGVKIACSEISDDARIFSDGQNIKGLGLFDAKVQTCNPNIEKTKVKILKKEGILKNAPDEIILNISKNGNISSDDFIIKNNEEIIGIQKEKFLGIYGYGIFENHEFTTALLNNIRHKKNLQLYNEVLNYSDYRESQIQKLAEEFKKYIDIEKLEDIINQGI